MALVTNIRAAYRRGLGRHGLTTVVGLLVAALVVGIAAPAAAGAVPAGDSSLAQGHAEVIAHGVALMPTIPVIWRVSTHPAQVPAQAPVAGRVLGFVLADQGAILITDANTNDQVRLAPGEAAFVHEGDRQVRTSLGGTPAEYVALDLVPATDKENIGTGSLVYASPSFTAPAGKHDLNLIRDVLEPGETASVPATGAPSLILITAGSVKAQAGGRSATLQAGTAVALLGGVTLTGAGSGTATFVAALIGQQVNATIAPAAPTAAAPATGTSITLTLRVCPAGLDASTALATLRNQCVVTTSGVDFKLDTRTFNGAKPPFTPLTLADATANSDGSFTWSHLPQSRFAITQTAFPARGMSLWAPASDGISYDPQIGIAVDTGSLDPAQEAALRHQHVEAFDFRQAAPSTGSITVAPFACPDGMTPHNLDPSQCQSASQVAVLQIFVVGSGANRHTLDDAQAQGGRFTWSDLPFGKYLLQAAQLADGYDRYLVPNLDGLNSDPAAGYNVAPDTGYIVPLDADHTHVSLNVYVFKAPAQAATGSIRVTAHLCPPGMDLTSLDMSACAVVTGGVDFMLTSDHLQRPYTLSDALDAGGGTYAWQGLPFGGYHIAQTRFPDGVTTYWIQTSDAVGGGPDVGYDAGIAADAPARDLHVFDFQMGASGAGAAAAATAAP